MFLNKTSFHPLGERIFRPPGRPHAARLRRQRPAGVLQYSRQVSFLHPYHLRPLTDSGSRNHTQCNAPGAKAQIAGADGSPHPAFRRRPGPRVVRGCVGVGLTRERNPPTDGRAGRPARPGRKAPGSAGSARLRAGTRKNSFRSGMSRRFFAGRHGFWRYSFRRARTSSSRDWG